MSGERSAYFVQMAERGAQRVVDRIQMVADRYGAPPNPNDDVITLAEMLQHLEDFGHTVGSPDCGHPLCEKARLMVANALTAMMQQPAVQ